MKKPVLLDARYVKPIKPGTNERYTCAMCSVVQARWVVGAFPNQVRTCAYCFLYGSDWGEQNSDEIEEFVLEVEEKMGRAISDQGVAYPEESDRILQAIVMVSKIRAGRVGRSEGSGS